MSGAWSVPVGDQGIEWRESRRWRLKGPGKLCLRGQYVPTLPGSVPAMGRGGPQEKLPVGSRHGQRARVLQAEDRWLRWA